MNKILSLYTGKTHSCPLAGNPTPFQEGKFNVLIIRKILTVALIGIFSLQSCKPENIKDGAEKEYFDIEGYFKTNIAQLKKQHGAISKTVTHNGSSETKNVQISNWEAELGLFIASDINKPAWKGSYTKKDSAGATIYTAKDPGLKTRRIIISKTKEGAVKQIFINGEVNNALYNTHETLNYFPDSAYSIEKYQKVKLLGANTYKVIGRFN